MAIDTRNKRASAATAGRPWLRLLPAPDGAVGEADRRFLGACYAGFAAAPPVVISVYPDPFLATSAEAAGRCDPWATTTSVLAGRVDPFAATSRYKGNTK